MSQISIDDLEAMVDTPGEPEVIQRRRSNAALKELICNPETVHRLVGGESMVAVAQDLGVTPQTLKKWIKTYGLADQMEMEAKRIIRAMSRKNLKEERYGILAKALASIVAACNDLRKNNDDGEARIINNTFIQKIDIALFGHRGGETSPAESGRLAQNAARTLPAIPVVIDAEPAEEP